MAKTKAQLLAEQQAIGGGSTIGLPAAFDTINQSTEMVTPPVLPNQSLMTDNQSIVPPEQLGPVVPTVGTPVTPTNLLPTGGSAPVENGVMSGSPLRGDEDLLTSQGGLLHGSPLRGEEDLIANQTATSENPVVDRTPAVPEESSPFSVQEFPELEGLDQNALYRIVNQINNKSRMGQKITMDDLNLISEIELRLGSKNEFTGSQDVLDEDVRLETQRGVDRAREIEQSKAKAIFDADQLSSAEFFQRSNLAREQGEDLKDASQQALSFSGFGRSTFAADQAQKIQKDVNRSIAFFDAERSARVNLARATAEGVAEEQLQGLRDRLLMFQDRARDHSLAIAEQLNEFNAQNTKNYEEKIDNIFKLSQSYTSDEPLTEQDIATVQSFATLLIDGEGNVDANILKEIPSHLLGATMQQAAALKGALPANSDTADSADTVKTDRGTFQRNPATSTYDIPVGAQGDRPTSNGPARGFRTDRHNNPTAFTTDIARQAGLVEGVDYTVGDAFPNNPNQTTALLIGDPFEQTIKVIDNIGFYTGAGQQRRTHTAMDKGQWDGLSDEQKRGVIAEMYQKEGGAGLDQLGNVQSQGEPIDPTSLSSLAQSIINGDLKGVNLAGAVKGSGMTVNDVLTEVANYRGSIGESDIEQNAEKINDLNALLDMGFIAQKGSGFGFGFLGGNQAKFDVTHDFIKENMTLDSFIDAKEAGATFGAMSEGEWKILRNSATKLDRRLNPKDYKAELIAIRSVMEGKTETEVIKDKKAFLRTGTIPSSSAIEQTQGQQTQGQQTQGQGDSPATQAEQDYINSL